jgi:hypothetical protein
MRFLFTFRYLRVDQKRDRLPEFGLPIGDIFERIFHCLRQLDVDFCCQRLAPYWFKLRPFAFALKSLTVTHSSLPGLLGKL